MKKSLQKHIEWLENQFDLSRVVNYLKEREKEEGGFSFAPDLYPDIEDTYYAIRIFQMLRVEVNRDKTVNYLKTIDWVGVGFPRAIYMLVYLHLSLDIDFPPPLTDFLKKDWSRFQILDAQYFYNEIQKLIRGPIHYLQSLSYFHFLLGPPLIRKIPIAALKSFGNLMLLLYKSNLLKNIFLAAKQKAGGLEERR